MIKRTWMLLSGLTALMFWGSTANVHAGVMTYKITVEVTAAPNPSGAVFDWDFISVPETFVGTFEADDTAAGAISNFDLTIGGIDIASSHSGFNGNDFDPNSLLLKWGGFEPNTFGSLVFIGDIFPSAPAPPNYIVAMDASGLPPFDPFFGITQNWVGTYSVSAVPEPGSFAIFGSIFLLANRRRRKS